MPKITAPERGFRYIKEDGRPEFAFADWVDFITQAVNNLPPLSGSGTPEANVSASVGRWYVDTALAAGSGVYYKESGEGNTGWVLRS